MHVCQLDKLWRHLAVRGPAVVVGGVKSLNRMFRDFDHVLVVLEQPLFTFVCRAHLAFRAVLVDEPVVTQGVCVHLTSTE